MQFAAERDQIKEGQRETLQDSFAPAESAGLNVQFAGAAGEEKAEAGGASEAIGIIVALIVLTITFGSLLTAGLPLLTAAVGVGSGILGITLVTAAVMAMLGERAWWLPAWLDRIIPNVDLEEPAWNAASTRSPARRTSPPSAARPVDRTEERGSDTAVSVAAA